MPRLGARFRSEPLSRPDRGEASEERRTERVSDPHYACPLFHDGTIIATPRRAF